MKRDDVLGEDPSIKRDFYVHGLEDTTLNPRSIQDVLLGTSPTTYSFNVKES